ncbi:hypothetical protein HF521_008269, partial [Silurus meridionalis]
MNLSDRCEHFSCPERSVSPAVYILLYVCSAAVVLLTVCGNLLVIISVFHFKQLHTPTNMLVLSLAVSDFFIGASVMPSVFIWTIESCWIFYSEYCIGLMIISFMLWNLSVYVVALISVDRYLALSNPFFYSNTISTRTMCIVVSSHWCLCLVYNTAHYYFSGTTVSPGMCPGECLITLNDFVFSIDLVISFIFPLSVIIILYSLVFLIAKKHATAIRELNNHTRPQTQKITSHSMKSERKAAKVLGILVAMFLACSLPYYIYSLLGSVIELHMETAQKLLILVYMNSTFNPVIYALFYPWFRRCIKLIITLQIFQTDSALISLNLSDRCEHFSCPERSVSPAVYILLYVCGAAVVLLTVCGNLLIIISVLHFKQLHTPTNMLVLSLAVTDFFIGAFVMPSVFIWTIESCWIFYSEYCISLMIISFILWNLSVYVVALISVDRYLVLSNPFFYSNTISTRTMCTVVSSHWCLCLVYYTAHYYFSGTTVSPGMCPGECLITLNDFVFSIDLVVSFIFPLSVIIILYSRVFLIAKKHATAIRELNNHTRPQTQKITSHSMKSERKAAKVLSILVAMFLACALPYYIYSLLGSVIELHMETGQKLLILVYMNSTINPVIYALFYPWFRRCIKLIITLQIFQTDSS